MEERGRGEPPANAPASAKVSSVTGSRTREQILSVSTATGSPNSSTEGAETPAVTVTPTSTSRTSVLLIHPNRRASAVPSRKKNPGTTSKAFSARHEKW